MNKYLAAKLDMYRAVAHVRTNPIYTADISAIVGIASGFGILEDHIAQAEAFDTARADAAAGGGAAKRLARTLFERSAVVVDGIFTAHAAKNKLAELLARVNKEVSDIRNMADEDLRVHGEFLTTQIPSPITPALTDLGLDAGLIATFTLRFGNYHTLINLPATKVGQESTYVDLLENEFAAADEHLDLYLDKLMRRFIEARPDIWAAYNHARTIHDPAYRTQAETPTPTPTPTPA